MQIGLITYPNSQNWGAVLQAYSTQAFINENTVNSCDLLNWEQVDKSLLRPYKTIHNLMHSALHVYSCKKRVDRFQKFRNEYLSFSDRCYTNDERIKLNEYYDAFITGSDQVWSTQNNICKPLFLDFVDDTKRKISYAPSFGTDIVKEEDKTELKRLIERLDYVSVREKSGVDIIREFSDVQAFCALDPVFLNTSNFWSKIAIKPHIKGNYIFVYPTQITLEFCSIVEIIKRKFNLPVYSLFYIPGCHTIKNVGPQEFLGLIQNATYVVATSFHAIVFSILFQKEFWALPHLKTGQRIIDMLDKFGIENSVSRNVEELNTEKIIDYLKISKIVEQKSDESRKWLLNALE